ncbi:hypothetical protein GV829_12240 [Sphingomonas lacunae]|uniref:Tetratricopeptide repeat protein n=1 Tax=Sphingomonas lacunae TaxID=2698828 RepID=A0A6M4AVI4_9SPHN|nr:hypothetical protein [Sphingomonas lacunae]QJQ33115.1 hypothetical protein GV829_12240 [Sphingomonas lacunae]
MRKVAKLVAALTITASLAGLASTSADAQRRNRGGEPAAPAAPTVSRAFGTAFAPVNTAIVAQDWATADATLPALKAAAATPYEQFLAAQTEFRIASGTRNAARQLVSIDAMIDSNGAPEADRPRLLVAGGQLAYNSGDYAKATSRLAQAVALGNATIETQTLHIDAMFRSGQTSEGLAAGAALIAAEKAAGRPAPETIYSLMARSLQEADRDADLSALLLDRMEAWPTAFNYRTAALVYLRVVPAENRNLNIDTLRFVIAGEAANDRRIYLEHVQNLAEEGLPFEALEVIRAARASGAVAATDATFNSIADTQEPKLAEDRSSLPGLERRALASPEARLATVAGDANLGYHNNARAEELYTAALTKNGADADLLHTRIGIARYQAGNHAGAIESFQRVQSALRSPLARMWITLTRAKMAAAAPAAPAAAEPTPAAS